MKIRCDFCDQEDAVVFCSADEAALCDTCDSRVHRANEVAQRHRRFSLVRPDSFLLCDICQERRALLFCREDRAMLCRECDYPIHAANEQTRKHCRFLLTGVKLTLCEEVVEQCMKRRRRVEQEVGSQTVETASSMEGAISVGSMSASGSGSGSGSRISEYLETLPGWHVEEFFNHLPHLS